jgi:hypothetical protein
MFFPDLNLHHIRRVLNHFADGSLVIGSDFSEYALGDEE